MVAKENYEIEMEKEALNNARILDESLATGKEVGENFDIYIQELKSRMKNLIQKGGSKL